MTIQDRIKKVRKDSGLNQLDFGKRIGLSESAICNYENGRREVSEQSVKSICREFTINYNWLKNGIGAEKPNEELNVLLSTVQKTYNLSDIDLTIIKAFLELDKPERDAFKRFIEKLKDVE